MSDFKPAISVIMPCYNAEKYIETAIRSFAENTVSTKCELIIINDGSTDGTRKIIDDMCSCYPDNVIRCIDIPNGGVSAARNRGIREARGKYISFIDSDDMYAKYFLESLLSGIRRTRADTCCCCWTRSEDSLTKQKVEAVPVKKKKLLDNVLYKTRLVAVWSTLYRRSIIAAENLRFSETIKYGEDIEFLWKYLSCCKTFALVNANYYFYRLVPGSAMNRVTWDKTQMLDAVMNIIGKMETTSPEYVESFASYMLPRKLISLQKDFASHGEIEYFSRIESQYDKKMMLHVAGRGKPEVRLAALTYAVSPRSFYLFFHQISGIQKKMKLFQEL